jgi:hypothetical protein
MKRTAWMTALAAALVGLAMIPAVWSAPGGKPLYSGMVQENGPAVQKIRDALTAYFGVNQRWPGNLDELVLFSVKNGFQVDLKAFKSINYFIDSKAGQQLAVFEFELAGSKTKGAFALANHFVR